MKQISSFMADIADEFKIVVVDAIRSLCLKCAPAMRGRAKSAWVGMRNPPAACCGRYSQKHRLLMSFLSNILREEGGFRVRKCAVVLWYSMGSNGIGHAGGLRGCKGKCARAPAV